jgi:ferredoxin
MKNLYTIRFIVAIVVFLLAILAICGFYPIKFLDLEFLPLIQRNIFDFSIVAIISLIMVIAITVLFGRIYCSTLCPFGTLQEIVAMITKRKGVVYKNLKIKYLIASIGIGFLIGGTAIVIRYFEPYTMFGAFISFSLYGIIFSLIILSLVFFKNRYFCSNICPVGTILGLISKFSIFKVQIDENKCFSCGLCAKKCYSGSIDFRNKTVDNETCVKCLKCLKECKKDALHYGKSVKNNIKFSLKRRNIIWASTVVIALGGAVKAGFEVSKTLAAKVKDIILPAGAKSANRMLNKCLNCNLCIKNCPNEILSKADDKFNAVHIDYSKGKKYCKFDCNTCSSVCPSGAIRKISIEEKQKTRIAMAYINTDKCSQNYDNCHFICINQCPLGAIFKDSDNKIVVDSSKCIGCGKCKAMCAFEAIDIFTIKEQQNI